ncbi:DNA replication/repair protein RecF [Aurantimicrobium minutum]|uniref:DNA replication/repair protein RecF n=1 Tax=Aurantimicrobium minutum TaxID=708131 RepID=UPI0024740A15|nr:DNA replication/repair protein RecF [Aurantimicrobium minutum]MDH6423458.1 DNA replication and repair protein RecF [Aurantimicrobium minutum]
MHVSSLSLRDFRNYAQADIEPGLGSVVLVGSNGQGKTNIVEAINYLATLGSHRTSIDSALIRQGSEAAIIRVNLAHDSRTILLEAQLNRNSANKAQANHANAKIRDFPRYISTVIFAPEDLMLVRGEPSGRRKFMDDLIIQRTPRLAGVVSDYDRVLKQRNTLLKTARVKDIDAGNLGTLDIWDERLVELGTEITAERTRLLQDLSGPLALAYQAIAGSDHEVSIELKPSIDGAESATAYAEKFRNLLESGRVQEIERGMTLVGPHRDDVEFGLNNLPAKGYASHGETWSYALSLKLSAARLLRSESVLGDPILILDDVFAELDSARRERLAEAVADFEQTFITAAVAEDVPSQLMTQVFHVKKGTISTENPAHE